jgi:antitoxin VapB
MTEFRKKQQRIHQLLAEHDLQALLLQRNSSFAWVTCGAASYVNTASSLGTATVLITSNDTILFTNNIESSRLTQEEKLEYQGWQFQISPWYEQTDTIQKITKNLKLGSDNPFPGAKDLTGEIARLRSRLTPEENVRFRVLGRLCAQAMERAIRSIQPGWTEHQIAACLARESLNLGATPIVNLVAADERIYKYRHPLPTYKTLEKYAMLVLCARRWGLVCSITRLVYFGDLPEDLRRKAEAVAFVDATMISGTRPGIEIGQLFAKTQAAYSQVGFPDEWQNHHQGGPAGYEPREYLATPKSKELVQTGQVFAWNPSITGVKSEDSIQVNEHESEIITEIPEWPVYQFDIKGKTIARPAILEIT